MPDGIKGWTIPKGLNVINLYFIVETMIQTKTIAMVLLLVIATVGAIGIGTQAYAKGPAAE